MRKNIIRSIAPVTQINDKCICPGPVSHLAEGALLIAFPGRLDQQVSKLLVQDRKESVYMDLVKSPGGLSAGLKKSIRVIGVPEDVHC